MHIEIVAIGDEVLAGQVVNSNAAYLSDFLHTAGYEISRHTVLSDDYQALLQGLQEVLDRSDVIVVTGGLGPTFDDVTKKAVCQLFNDKLVEKDSVLASIESRYKKCKENEALAHVPSQATLLDNEVGTAPGFAFTKDHKLIIFLPGVPNEMKVMWVKAAWPLIEKKLKKTTKRIVYTLHFCLLSEIELLPAMQDIKKQFPIIKMGIYPAYSHVTVRLSAPVDEVEHLTKMKQAIERKYKQYILPDDCYSVAGAFHDQATKKGIKVAFAESCSGGYLASLITHIPGSSAYFLGSIVAYDNEVKEKVLRVDNKLIQKYGTVSTQVVEAMLKGIFQITKADYAIAISGIAGPTGGSKEKPVGTVCIGIAKKDGKILAKQLHFPGNRSAIIEMASNFALASLWQWLKEI